MSDKPSPEALELAREAIEDAGLSAGESGVAAVARACRLDELLAAERQRNAVTRMLVDRDVQLAAERRAHGETRSLLQALVDSVAVADEVIIRASLNHLARLTPTPEAESDGE